MNTFALNLFILYGPHPLPPFEFCFVLTFVAAMFDFDGGSSLKIKKQCIVSSYQKYSLIITQFWLIRCCTQSFVHLPLICSQNCHDDFLESENKKTRAQQHRSECRMQLLGAPRSGHFSREAAVTRDFG